MHLFSFRLFMVIFIVILVLAALAILAMKGRSGHKGLAALQGVRYAHRGLHGNGLPENSMAAFRAALDHGYGIELDIHLMKDPPVPGSTGAVSGEDTSYCGAERTRR